MLSQGVQKRSEPLRLAQLKSQLDGLATHPQQSARRVPLAWPQADAWLGGGLCCGAIHEWMGLVGVPPISLLVHTAAQAAVATHAGSPAAWLVCIGREVWPTPSAIISAGGGDLLRHLLLIDPPTESDRHWAIELALRSESLIVIADASGVDMATSRRLQLAAESGQSLGLLARPPRDAQAMSVATTRWLVQPVPTHASSPRWRVTLARCKGLQSSQSHSTQDGVPGIALAHVARGFVTDDRSLLVEVNDAGRLVPVHADIRERRDPAAAAS